MSVKKAIRIDREIWEHEDETAQNICQHYIVEAIRQELVDKIYVNKEGQTRYYIEVSIENNVPQFYVGDGAPENDPTYTNAVIEIESGHRKIYK